MIKLKFGSAGHPDYSRIVGAEMDKEYTVVEFINEILEMYPKNYGEINIDDNIFLNYKNGALDWSFMNLRLSGLVVEKVEGMSSYYNTDYKIILKGNEPKEEKKKPMGYIMDILKEMQRELHDVRLKYKEKTGMNILSIKTDQSGSISLSTDYRNGVFGFDIEV